MKKIIFALIILSMSLVCFLACEKKAESIVSDTRIVLGTVCTITLYEQGTREVYDKLFTKLESIEQAMSVNIAESEISKINSLSGIEKGELSNDTYTVLSKALEYAKDTEGAFNPAIGPLVSLWAIGTDLAKVPTQEEISAAIALGNWNNVLLSTENGKKFALLKEKGMSLDLGGIAKGFAADEMVSILEKSGIERAIIDLGGNIYAFGEKENGDPWRVGIKNPFDSTGSPAVRLDVKNTSVVTSGVYERFFEKEGIRYHHLLDSKTGYPIDNGLMSVTIVTESSMLADVLSTAVFVLGQEQGMLFLDSIGEKGFCINNKREIISTENLKSSIVILDDSFILLQ